MKKRYIIRLSAEERDHLNSLVNRGREAASRCRHAQVLLLADEGELGKRLSDCGVAECMGCTRRTVEQIRERCVCEGLAAALERKKRSRKRSRVLDGEDEARLVSIACSEPPAGRARWTLQMLGDRLVELEVVDNHVAEQWAQGVRRLVQEDYPQAKRITLVMDNLNTHSGASLYEAFPPALARSLLDKLEFVYLCPWVHAQAWQLAQYGRMRVQCTGPTVLGPATTGYRDRRSRSRCLDDAAGLALIGDGGDHGQFFTFPAQRIGHRCLA